MKKCPSSIWLWDSDPQPSDEESPPITTMSVFLVLVFIYFVLNFVLVSILKYNSFVHLSSRYIKHFVPWSIILVQVSFFLELWSIHLLVLWSVILVLTVFALSLSTLSFSLSTESLLYLSLSTERLVYLSLLNV